jgi:hypothetical protein
VLTTPVIYTDHKPCTYAFQQKRDKCSPGQFNHLDFVAQFTTAVRHISGQDNVVAYALSRVESITAAPSPDALAASQEDDGELRVLLALDTALQLEKQQIPGTAVSIYGDMSARKPRPYVPGPLRHQVFQSVHDLSHPGTKATARLWPGIQKDCRNWARACQACQRSKSSRHIVTPVETSRCLQPVSCTSTLTSWSLSQHQQATGTASLRSTVSRAGQKQFQSRTSHPRPWHAPSLPAGYPVSVARKLSPRTRDVNSSRNSFAPLPGCVEPSSPGQPPNTQQPTV